jgi:hypothetical protein
MTSDSVVVINLASARQPEYREKKSSGYIEFGYRNEYPEYLLSLYNNSAKHGAIIRSKTKYIIGKGWTTESGQPSAFIEKVNAHESLDTLSKKVQLDVSIFGGAYLHIVYGVLGHQIASISHIDYLKVRTNKDNTQFWIRDEWNMKADPQEKVLNAFNPNATTDKSQILFLKEYRPGSKAYPLPDYFSALNYIESDIEVSKHVLSNAGTGFTASKMVTFTNGEPAKEAKRDLTDHFEKRFTGSDGKKLILNFVMDAARKPIVDDLGASDLTKEDFTRVDELIQQNIYAGHEITSPALFGISQAGKLGTSNELNDAYSIFKNTYVNDKQMQLEGVFNMLAKLKGETEVLKIQPLDPIDMQITFADIKDIVSKEYIFEKIGYVPSDYLPQGANPTTGEAMVNDHIKNMTAKQHQEMMRIIRQFNKGQLNQAQASALLKSGLGLTDSDIIVMLGIDDGTPMQMSSQDALGLFMAFGESKSNYNIVKTAQRFSDDLDMQYFADVTQIESNILDLIAKDKRITPEVIADTLKVTVKRVNEVIAAAVSKDLIKTKETKEGKGDQLNIIVERVLAKPISEIVGKIKPETTQILIRYSYEWRNEIPVSERNTSAHPSRDFCKALMSMDKVYSRADIEQISSRLGYSVWDRQGGWWNDSGDIKPHCRHMWASNIVIRK